MYISEQEMSLTLLKEVIKPMKTKALILCSALPLTALMASGCYTALSSPYEVADLHDEAPARDVEAPTIGQFDDRDYMDDLYHYPGVRGGYSGYGYGGYGRYGGYYYPTARYVPYYYGYYDSHPYYYGGYGPYSYGYDPYYRSSRGYYVSPGYQLVSTRQLENLRAASRLNKTPMTVDPATAAEVQRREEEVWQRRVEPRVRNSPPPPRATSSVSPSSGTPSPTPKASKAPSAPASKKTSTEKVAMPKKRKRRR